VDTPHNFTLSSLKALPHAEHNTSVDGSSTSSRFPRRITDVAIVPLVIEPDQANVDCHHLKVSELFTDCPTEGNCP
jgi:hypothetical protein